VYFVDLAPVTDPVLVLPTIAHILQLAPSQAPADVADALVRRLQDRRLLLVLDNFEHLLAAAPKVSRILEQRVDLKVLVTSRAPLHLRCVGSVCFPFPRWWRQTFALRQTWSR
jgi:predicted ATPase